MKRLVRPTEPYAPIEQYIFDAPPGQIISLNTLIELNNNLDKKAVHRWIKATKQPVASLGYGIYRKLSAADLNFIKDMESLSLAVSNTSLSEEKSSLTGPQSSVNFHFAPPAFLEATPTPPNAQVRDPLEPAELNSAQSGQQLKFYAEQPISSPKKRRVEKDKENYNPYSHQKF